MTTLAYRDGVLAADTLMTGNGMAWAHLPKIGKIKGVLYGACGLSNENAAFREWVRGGMKGQAPRMTDSAGYLVTAQHILRRSDGGWIALPDGPWTDGSGEQIAMGALEAGATAEEAVRIAIRRDIHSGGDVQVVSL